MNRISEKLQHKLIPSIYHQKRAEELNYTLFLAKAQLVRKDSQTVINKTLNRY